MAKNPLSANDAFALEFMHDMSYNRRVCTSEGDCGNAHFDMVMNCNRGWIREWEMFCAMTDGVKKIHNGTVFGLRSYNWNRYCASEQSDEHVIHCNRIDLRDWEYFMFLSNSDGELRDGDTVYLYSVQWGTYCYPRSGVTFDMEMRCDATTQGGIPYTLHVVAGRSCDSKETEPRVTSDEYYSTTQPVASSAYRVSP
uniref:Uncharacterized protein n=1 Tax=viral metagenome TaxID=1070528 RepID=A0A6C0LY51_9ZZZZ